MEVCRPARKRKRGSIIKYKALKEIPVGKGLESISEPIKQGTVLESKPYLGRQMIYFKDRKVCFAESVMGEECFEKVEEG